MSDPDEAHEDFNDGFDRGCASGEEDMCDGCDISCTDGYCQCDCHDWNGGAYVIVKCESCNDPQCPDHGE